MTATEVRPTPLIDPEVHRSAALIPRLIAKLDTVAPALEAEAEANEQSGLLSDRTIELLRTTEVPSMLISESLGGLGMFPGDALHVLDRLCQIDGSIGWIGANWSSTGLSMAFFPPEVAAEILGDGVPLFGVSGAPTGMAVPTEGGFRFSGAWSYGSGDLQAEYVLCAGLEAGPDGAPVTGSDGMPQIRAYMVAGKDIQPNGNWDTLGLRATGSIDFTLSDVFVPERFMVDAFGGPPRYAERQQSAGILPLVYLLHTAFGLGATRRLLDELARFAQVPSSRGTMLADDPLFRDAFARHEMIVRAARAAVFETWADVDKHLQASQPLNRRLTTLLRGSLVYIHDVARELATFVFAKGSGTTLRAGHLQRWVRDTLAGCQHLIVADSVYTHVGWELLGAPKNLAWTHLGLMPTSSVSVATAQP